MDGLVDELAALVGAVSFQQRGLSPSSIGGPYSVQRHVDDALAVLDGLELTAAWMIGHSWGGYLAMAIAARAPDRTLGWIAIDPLGLIGDGGMEEFGDWLGRDLSADERARIDAVSVNDEEDPEDVESFSQALPLIWRHYFADPETAPAYEEIPQNARVYVDTVADAMALNEEGELARDLAKANRPGLVVCGAESGLRHASEATALAVGANLSLVAGAAHFPWLEIPGSIQAIVADAVRT
jgi:pimeloyl-ACP methyl ester carboxylesterase